MTCTDQQFLEAIFASPDDATPKLVYADWLDEQGQRPKAEFIRKSHEYHHGGLKTKDRTILWSRLAALVDDQSVLPRLYRTLGVTQFWTAECGPSWDGGFLFRVTVGPHYIARHGYRDNNLDTPRRILRLARLQPLVRELFITHGFSSPLFPMLDLVTRVWPLVEKVSIWRTESYDVPGHPRFGPVGTWDEGVKMLARWPRLRLVQSSISHIGRLQRRLGRPEVALKVRIF